MRYLFLILMFLSWVTSIRASVSPQSEIQDFFGEAHSKPNKEQLEEIKALWRKAQIGAREDRLAARADLVEFGSLVASFLETNLDSGSAADVRTAALILGRVGDKGAANRARAILFNSKKTATARRHLALMLGLIGGKEDVASLVQTLKSNKRNDYRRALVHALGRIGDEDAVKELVAQYGKDKAQAFRRAVILSFGRIGGNEVKSLIRKAMGSRKESLRRTATIAAASLRSVDFVPSFKHLLRDSDETVVRHALIGLSLLVDPTVSTAIKRSGTIRVGEGETRALAVTALGTQSDPVAIQLLHDRGKSKLERNLLVRRALAFALSRQPKAMTLTVRKRLYADRDPEVGRAIWLATSFGSQRTTGIILEEVIFKKALHDRVRLTLLELIAHHDPERAEMVFRRIKDERRFKKKVLVRSAELQEILQRNGDVGRGLIRARIQVEVDDLGGSPEWNLLQAYHQEFLAIENIVRPLSFPGAGPRPGNQPGRRPDPWTNENEDLRLWFDRYHYHDRRDSLDVGL